LSGGFGILELVRIARSIMAGCKKIMVGQSPPYRWIPAFAGMTESGNRESINRIGIKWELDIKGLVFDIKRYAIHDGPGIRTTVFFKGCPLQCQWCQNPESRRNYAEHGLRKGRCVGCGRCVEVCPQQAISLVENDSNGLVEVRPITDVEKCKLCGRCVDACTAGAREIIGREMSVDEVMAEVEKDGVLHSPEVSR